MAGLAGRPVNKWLIAVTAMLATTMEILDISIANVALDHIRGSLSAGVDEVTWVLTSYLVSNAIVLPLTGWLSALFGRKRFFAFCTVLFTVSSFLAGSAPTLGLLVFFRILQGLGGGALVPMSQAILMETFPPREQGMAMAVWGVGIMFGPIAGPTLGGWITDHLSWRWIFYINLPIGALATFLVLVLLDDPPYLQRRLGRIDGAGLVLLAVGVGCLQIVLDKGEREDWFSSRFITTLAVVSAVALVLFVIQELETREPVVDLRLLKIRTFAVATFLITLVSFCLYGAIVLMPLYAQLVLGYTPWLAGLFLAPGGIGSLITLPIAGRLITRIDPRLIVGTGALVNAFAMWQLAGVNTQVSFWELMWPRFIQGIGLSGMFVPLATIALSPIPRERLGYASGLYNLLRNLGGSIGIAMMTTLLSRGSQVHQTVLAGHVNPFDVGVQQRLAALTTAFASAGADPATAQRQALAAIYRSVQQQASAMAFLDNFRRLTLLFLIVIPLLLLMRRPEVGRQPAVH